MSSQDYLYHAAGLESGQALHGTINDLALFSLLLDVRIIVIHADEIQTDSSEEDMSKYCTVAGFRHESEKSRVVCAVLSGDHFDIGAVHLPGVRAIFDNGEDWECGLTHILCFFRETKRNPTTVNSTTLLVL